MKLWTIQHKDVWEKMKRANVFRTDTNIMREVLGDTTTTFEPAYRWMANQMIDRVGEPPEGVEYPVWAWHMWEGKRKRRDMRESGHAPQGTPIVQMTIDVPDEMVLLSDFDAWHHVLNKWYIPDSEQDDNKFEKEYIRAEETWHTLFENPEIKNKIVKSWDKIFKPSELSNYISHGNSIQATFWELKADWIIKVEQFVAR